MGILKTRYRDIPFEEAVKCATPEGLEYCRNAGVNWDQQQRRKPVSVLYPPITTPQWKYARCGGPFYRVLKPDGTRDGEFMVCVHIAEIGD